MGGAIDLESTPGEGSIFNLNLAFEQCVDEENDKASNGTSGEESNREAINAKVLLVEDNPVNQLVAATYLEKMAVQFSVANSGQEALKLFQEDIYDVVLMDIQMPGMDGIDTTAAIREIEYQTLVVTTHPLAINFPR